MLPVFKSFWAINLMSRVFANGPGDRGSIPGQVIPKTQKMVLDATLLSTQYYKVRIKSKVEQSRERSSALPYTSNGKWAFGSPLIKVGQLYNLLMFIDSLVSHNILTNHTFGFQNSAIFAFIHDKNKRRMIETCSIAHHNTIWQGLFSKFHPLQEKWY